MNLGDSINKGLIFCINPKRWFPFFLMDLLGLSLILGIFNNANLFSSPNILSGIYVFSIMFLEIIIVSILLFVINLVLKGAVIHQSYKEKEYKKSFLNSYRKIPSLIMASIIIIAINLFAISIPYFGLIFIFISILAFYFVYQNIIIKNMGFANSLEYSFELFKKRCSSLIIIYFALGILSCILSLMFSIPLIYMIFTILISGGEIVLNPITAISLNLNELFICLLISMIGKSISRVFYIKTQTEIYLQIIKKKAK
ncbi:MAG: hypothetical protein KAT28_02045 [Candidatus Aenigmarchaeota archaeon]|nr:hypothetical protein [Candidatus Aenigmarchaeota archaeon]